MAEAQLGLERWCEHLLVPPPIFAGRVTQVRGLLVEGAVKGAALGDLYHLSTGRRRILAEVVALRGEHVMLMPFDELTGLQVGAGLTRAAAGDVVHVGRAGLGRVVDAFGRPLDGGAAVAWTERWPLRGQALQPHERAPIQKDLSLGVRVLDAFIPCGIGQRLGIFAGPGVGKSTLLGMMTRNASVDVTVLGIVGERTREVQHFVDHALGSEGLKSSIVVAATSDRPATERVRAAYYATALAEALRAQGLSVLLCVDSLTRLCMAQREIGLAVGEPPTSRGYPPSAFSILPRLVERVAPRRAGGAITAFYTVLVEGDDMTEPVADTVRGLLDGHIILSRQRANAGVYPAVDVVQSLSRLESELLPGASLQHMRQVRAWLAAIEEAKPLIAIGAYQKGGNPLLDTALAKAPLIEAILRQEECETTSRDNTLLALKRLVEAPI